MSCSVRLVARREYCVVPYSRCSWTLSPLRSRRAVRLVFTSLTSPLTVLSSDCENLRDSRIIFRLFSVSIFSLIQIFKEQNFAVNLLRHTLKFSCFRSKDGGAMRDRTADLLRAKQALSQLSYSPIVVKPHEPQFLLRQGVVTRSILKYVSVATTQHQQEFGRPEWT